MSLKLKLPLIILLTFLLNALCIIGYYHFSLSQRLMMNSSAAQAALDRELTSIEAVLEGEKASLEALEAIAAEEKMTIQVFDLNNQLIFESLHSTGSNVGITSSRIVAMDGTPYLIQLSKVLQIERFSQSILMREMMTAEVVILSVILLIFTVLIYFGFIRRLIGLEVDMENFERGITPKKTWRRDELGSLKNRFVRLTASLDAEKQMQNRMMASISHDIKTPLTSIMGYAERLKIGNVKAEKRQKYLDIIYNKSQNIQEIVEEFDDYVGFNMQANLKPQGVTAAAICSGIQLDYKEDLSAEGIGLDVVCTCSDALVLADLGKLRRVFGNLFSNAIQHAARPNLSIRTGCDCDAENVRFYVADNGGGASEDVLEKMFEPLFTTDAGRRVSGLGLSICRSIIQAHGGRIYAENNRDGGLTVYFTLLLCQD